LPLIHPDIINPSHIHFATTMPKLFVDQNLPSMI
jgi:hypothetical protein